MKVLAFGEILWDIIEGKEHLGGAPFNFAAHAAKCGHKSFILSRLGRDERGLLAFDQAKTFGVDVSLIQWDEQYPTGIVDVQLANGQPDYVIRPHAAYDYVSADDILDQLEKNVFDVFYFGSLSQRNVASAQALHTILSKNRFKHVFYDVNLRKAGYSDEIIRKSLAACTILKLNHDEVNVISKILAGHQLTHEVFCKYVKSQYPNVRTIVITAAENGCFVFESTLQYLPGTPVTVKDAVGSGDAFSAAFMHIYAASGRAVTAAKVANHVGAFVATQAGAIPQYPDEIIGLLNVNSRSVTGNLECA